MKRVIDAFVADPKVALVGASRDPKKWGNALLKELVLKGKDVHPVNPSPGDIEGRACVASVNELPAGIANVIVALPAAAALRAIEGFANPNLKRLWLLHGAVSPEVVAAAERKGLELVKGRCPLMFIEPVDGPHGFHRFFVRLFGRMPA